MARRNLGDFIAWVQGATGLTTPRIQKAIAGADVSQLTPDDVYRIASEQELARMGKKLPRAPKVQSAEDAIRALSKRGQKSPKQPELPMNSQGSYRNLGVGRVDDVGAGPDPIDPGTGLIAVTPPTREYTTPGLFGGPGREIIVVPDAPRRAVVEDVYDADIQSGGPLVPFGFRGRGVPVGGPAGGPRGMIVSGRGPTPATMPTWLKAGLEVAGAGTAAFLAKDYYDTMMNGQGEDPASLAAETSPPPAVSATPGDEPPPPRVVQPSFPAYTGTLTPQQIQTMNVMIDAGVDPRKAESIIRGHLPMSAGEAAAMVREAPSFDRRQGAQARRVAK